MTTADLSLVMPTDENGWEYKDAQYLLPAKRNDLLAELGKQTSAFANTGGGYLVFGVGKDTHTLQPCEQAVGTQPMQEWLATQIQQSVEYPLQGFNVYRIPFDSEPEKSVFVVKYPDSIKAPHQCKKDFKYYWRCNFKSEPAPHFYLELLRNRLTRATLGIATWKGSLEVDPHKPFGSNQVNWIKLVVNLSVTNHSFSCATLWGLHFSFKVRSAESGQAWSGPPSRTIKPNQMTLLPGESYPVQIEMRKNLQPGSSIKIGTQIEQALSELVFEIIPVSNNHMAEPIEFDFGKPDYRDGVLDEFKGRSAEIRSWF